MVRKAKNEEWVKLGERMEKSSMANRGSSGGGLKLAGKVTRGCAID